LISMAFGCDCKRGACAAHGKCSGCCDECPKRTVGRPVGRRNQVAAEAPASPGLREPRSRKRTANYVEIEEYEDLTFDEGMDDDMCALFLQETP
jgi:hypothetical protein